MSAAGAQPFWRAAGMTYLGYANRCAVFVRKCQKEPFKTQSLSREQVHFKVAPWADGVQQKGGLWPHELLPSFLSVLFSSLIFLIIQLAR